MILKNEVYNVLKWIAQIFLPAAAVLWVAIATVWKLPLVQEVETTILAADAFLGALLGVASSTYNKAINSDVTIEREDNSDENN